MQKINLIFKIMEMYLIHRSNTDPHPVYEKKIIVFLKDLRMASFLWRQLLKKNIATLTKLGRKNTDTDKNDKILLPYFILVQ